MRIRKLKWRGWKNDVFYLSNANPEKNPIPGEYIFSNAVLIGYSGMPETFNWEKLKHSKLSKKCKGLGIIQQRVLIDELLATRQLLKLVGELYNQERLIRNSLELRIKKEEEQK